ncbi:MAG: hypothetical protein IJE78_08815 [Bacteroidaceae bacterium]|nr:hypothetical protein [Bacteroidaceae bacterium]
MFYNLLIFSVYCGERGSKTFSYSSVKIEVAYDWELKVLTVDEMDWQEYLEA